MQELLSNEKKLVMGMGYTKHTEKNSKKGVCCCYVVGALVVGIAGYLSYALSYNYYYEQGGYAGWDDASDECMTHR